MSKKTLGYVELEWTCPNCGGRNKGNVSVCTHCGAPQPEDVKFEQPAEEKIIEDAKVIERAKAGPDIHCAYCGTRNPAGAETCSRCGAALGEGTARETGQVLGSHKDEPAPDIECPFCATPNPATALKCKNCGANIHEPKTAPAPEAPAPAAPRRSRTGMLLLVGIGIVVVICFAALFALFGRTDDVTGKVSDISWERSIVILAPVPVRREAWQDQIPSSADVGFCHDEVRYTSDQPEPNSQEICGTPYTVDTGSGFGEVVQDCEYLVYDTMCEYSVLELAPFNTVVERGNDLSPEWPALRLEAEQQEGDSNETYTITFEADGERYTYTTRNPNEFAQFAPGSSWTLKVNALGNVMDVEPSN